MKRLSLVLAAFAPLTDGEVLTGLPACAGNDADLVVLE